MIRLHNEVAHPLVEIRKWHADRCRLLLSPTVRKRSVVRGAADDVGHPKLSTLNARLASASGSSLAIPLLKATSFFLSG